MFGIPGHYCPQGTESANQYPCAIGTYNPATNADVVSLCLPCTAGSYCVSEGLAAVTGPCDAGWYCTLSGVVAQDSTNGGQCQPGDYCEEGSSSPTTCTAGMYCETVGLSAPTANCSDGYYCVGGAETATPTDGTTGDICPPGYYCPSGVSWPLACPLGTYSASTGNTGISNCLDCSVGEYCGLHNLTETSGKSL